MARVLVIQVERLGDLLQTTPLLQDLAATPDTTVDLIFVQEYQAALEGFAAVRTRLPVPAAVVAALNREVKEARSSGQRPAQAEELVRSSRLPRYDRLINVSHGEAASWLASHLPADEREGAMLDDGGEWLCAGAAHVYFPAFLDFRPVNAFNIVDLYRAAARAGQRPGPGARPVIAAAATSVATVPARPRVALNPGTHDPRRRWPPACFATLCDLLAGQGIAPVLVGSKEDEPVCAEVAARCRTGPANLCGLMSVGEQARLFQESDLVVSNDTGAVHIAAAVGTRVVGVYGGVSFVRETAPWGEGHLILQAPMDERGEGIDRITPELVAAAVAERLGRGDAQALADALSQAGVSGWETFFLPPEADPLGGLAYRPVHRAALQADDLAALALRHALAGDFVGRPGTSRLTYVDRTRIGSEARAGIARVRAGLEELVAELESVAARVEGAGLAVAQGRPAVAEQLVKALDAGVREIGGRGGQAPVVTALARLADWTVRMIPMLPPGPLFARTAHDYRRLAAIGTETSGLLSTL